LKRGWHNHMIGPRSVWLWLRERPLKISACCNILGDIFTTLAGISHNDILLSLPGVFGLSGALILIGWGKGGKSTKRTENFPLILKYVMFWRFPVEASAGQVKIAALFYIAAGFDLLGQRGSISWPLIGLGLSIFIAMLSAVFLPDKKGWPRPLLISGIFFQFANVMGWAAALSFGNTILIVAQTMHTLASFILAASHRHEN